MITHARLGLVLDGFGNEPASRVTNARRSAVDQSWEQPWGEQRVIRDRHAELRVTLVGRRCRAYRAFRSHRPGVRRRLRLSLRVQPASPPRAMSPSSTSSPSSGLGRRLGCLVVPGAPSRSRRISLQARAPARSAPRGDAADAAVARPVPVDPRGRAGRLRQHEPAPHRRAHAQGRSHALVRRRAGSQARPLRHAVAHGADRRHADGSSPIRASSSISTSRAALPTLPGSTSASTWACGGRCISTVRPGAAATNTARPTPT